MVKPLFVILNLNELTDNELTDNETSPSLRPHAGCLFTTVVTDKVLLVVGISTETI